MSLISLCLYLRRRLIIIAIFHDFPSYYLIFFHYLLIHNVTHIRLLTADVSPFDYAYHLRYSVVRHHIYGIRYTPDAAAMLLTARAFFFFFFFLRYYVERAQRCYEE